MATEALVEVNRNPMREVRISKVVLNIGVGRSGEIIERAKRWLSEFTGQTPSLRTARRTVKDFGIHRGEPIGVTVSLRGRRAGEILKRLLAAKNNRISRESFDRSGNCSFGIKKHIEIPNVKYDPSIGIFGMNVAVVLERAGHRVARRRRAASHVGIKHRITVDDAVGYFKGKLGVEVV